MFSFTQSRENPSYRNEQDFQINEVLQGPSGTALRSQISHGIGKAQEAGYTYIQQIWALNKDPRECYHRLHQIMREDLKCPKVAHDMKPYLDALEFDHNMTKYEEVSKIYFSKSCNNLTGDSARVCQRVLSEKTAFYVKYELFSQMIGKCFLEQAESQETSSLSLALSSHNYQQVSPFRDWCHLSAWHNMIGCSLKFLTYQKNIPKAGPYSFCRGTCQLVTSYGICDGVYDCFDRQVDICSEVFQVLIFLIAGQMKWDVILIPNNPLLETSSGRFLPISCIFVNSYLLG